MHIKLPRFINIFGNNLIIYYTRIDLQIKKKQKPMEKNYNESKISLRIVDDKTLPNK